MSNQPVVIKNETKVFYTVHVNENLFVLSFNIQDNVVKVTDGNSTYSNMRSPYKFEHLSTAKKAAELSGGTVKKHVIHTLATETIGEVNINE